MAFLITCSIFCMNDVFASKKSPSDYEKISEQIAIDVEKYFLTIRYEPYLQHLLKKARKMV